MERSSTVKNATGNNFEVAVQTYETSQEAEIKVIKSFVYGLEMKLVQWPADSELALRRASFSNV